MDLNSVLELVSAKILKRSTTAHALITNVTLPPYRSKSATDMSHDDLRQAQSFQGETVAAQVICQRCLALDLSVITYIILIGINERGSTRSGLCQVLVDQERSTASCAGGPLMGCQLVVDTGS